LPQRHNQQGQQGGNQQGKAGILAQAPSRTQAKGKTAPGNRTQQANRNAQASGRQSSVGTGSGRDVQSRVVTVAFVRSSRKHTVTIHYDAAQALQKDGVPLPGLVDLAPGPGSTK
jgi:hypothetical protein